MTRPGRSQRRPGRSGRGAVALFVAIASSLLVVMATLCVDLGMQRVVRSDMQSVADVVALDMARRLAEVTPGTSAWRDAVAASLDRNDDTLGRRPDAAPSAEWVCTARLCARATAGWVDHDHVFTTTAPAGTAYGAVRVEATAGIDFGFSRGRGGAVRSAVARRTTSACFDLGSYAAAVRSGDGTLLAPLNRLLGLDLTLVGYQALAAADARVSLAELAAAPAIGSPDALLDSSGLTLGRLIGASAYALGHRAGSPGTDSSAALAALDAVEADLGAAVSTTVAIGELLQVDAGDAAALAGELNLLDLLASAIRLADGSNLVSTGVEVPALLGMDGPVTVQAHVVQGAVRACGEPGSEQARARQSQIGVDLDIPGAGVPIGGAVLQVGDLHVGGGLGNAEVALVAEPGPVCREGTAAEPDTYDVSVGSGLLGLGLSVPVALHGDVDLISLGLGPTLDALLAGVVGVLTGVQEATLTFDDVAFDLGGGVPGIDPGSPAVAELAVPQNVAVPRTIGGAPRLLNSVALPASATGTITLTVRSWSLLGGSQTTHRSVEFGADLVQQVLAAALAPTTEALDQVVSDLDEALVPIARLLGLGIAGADVYSVARPSCSAPQLVG